MRENRSIILHTQFIHMEHVHLCFYFVLTAVELIPSSRPRKRNKRKLHALATLDGKFHAFHRSNKISVQSDSTAD